MAQIKTFSWTNPSTAVARNLDVGFEVTEITTINKTDGGSFYWCVGMDNASFLDVDAGTITTTNGFTPLSQSAMYGASITAFSNANPGVITASDITQVGIVAGDTIKVAEVADDGSGTSLNGEFTVASVTTTAITLVENTSAPTYSVYVSGGKVTRVSDSNGDPVPTQNYAIQGITVGTSVVGTDNDDTIAVVRGANSVT
jgi:hypothetical protein